jgi:hypothetical protein
VVHCHHYSPFVYASIARLYVELRIGTTEHDDRPTRHPRRSRTANRVLRMRRAKCHGRPI